MVPTAGTDFDVGDQVQVYGMGAVVTGYAPVTGRFEVVFGEDPWNDHAENGWVNPEDMLLVAKHDPSHWD